eukprot:scaffold3224_cov158-Amphora_coffeaeformis.AAC.24
MSGNTEVKKTGVVKRMIAADLLGDGETLRVRVYPKAGGDTTKNNSHGRTIPCIISDGGDHIRGCLIGNAATLVEVHDERSLILSVESFVASLANVKDQDALVYISSASIQNRSTKHKRTPLGRMTSAQSQKRIQGGVAPAFLKNFLHVLPDEALSGLHQLSADSRDQIARVSNCIAQHSAMTTLHAAIASRATAANDHLRDRMKHYESALQEFQESQMDRQKASLTSNAGREDAARSNLIVEQYSKALREALTDEHFFTLNRLCQWHAIICGEGIHAEAGRLRTKAVRVGHVHFRPHQHAQSDLDTVCQELMRLETRFLQKMNLPKHSNNGIAAVTLAAAVLFAIVDVHAFCDGNGRLARIAFNWCLRRFGIPFAIHLFATPSQRSEYTEAIVKTRRNLALVGRGHCSESDIVHALDQAGAFAPMVELILDRLSKTIVEFEKLVEEKSRIGSEEAEFRAAKRVRDRERAGTCLICFEDNPNIATLCCGKAVHLNCVAQWISSNTSCPNCREQFPALSPRIHSPQENSDYETTEDDDEMFGEADETDETVEDMEDDTTSDTVLIPNAIIQDFDRNQSYFPDRQSLQDLANHLMAQHMVNAMANEDDTTTSFGNEDDTTPSASEGTDDPNDTTTNSDTDDMVPAPSRPDLPPYCIQDDCRNRAARDCSNATCGRCCLLYGQYSCERHNA